MTVVGSCVAIGPSTAGAVDSGDPAEKPNAAPPLGAFLGSGAEGVARIAKFEKWLGSPVKVGHTYLPGENWAGIEGPSEIIGPWARWRAKDRSHLLVVNVPMIASNEVTLPDGVVSSLLRGGASGAFDNHFQRLAERLVKAGAPDTVIIPGWEMNGITYTSRCHPDPVMWKIYWRRIVATMRSVTGARFRFDFNATRGRDAIPWTECYPGDDVVDIIGSDSYDQPQGMSFAEFIKEPYGLQAQADFAAARKKPISFPEWGLFHNSDNPDYIQGMHKWMTSHDVAYQTLTDYCPHGVWQCAANPQASRTYRSLFGGLLNGVSKAVPDLSCPPTVPTPPPTPTPTVPSQAPMAAPSPSPGAPVPTEAPSPSPPAPVPAQAPSPPSALPSPATPPAPVAPTPTASDPAAAMSTAASAAAAVACGALKAAEAAVRTAGVSATAEPAVTAMPGTSPAPVVRPSDGE
ncbi:glycoside hydrolase family 26 protein [Spirillospora sp. NPDC048911]|uniref:glycoside hydrolase family 26 protein n=1 Tax=Spirillospora sp. NPDC048911 TaxID=3364527 RepID=UPI00371A1CDD